LKNSPIETKTLKIMKLVKLFFAVIVVLPLFANSQQKINKEVPLIDREIFFGNPEISSGKLSPDGKWISFMKEYNGIMNIWVKAFDAPFTEAKPLTNNERPIGGYFWTHDGKYILYVKDAGGDENYHVFAVNPKGKAKENGVPVSRDLTPNEKVRAAIYQVSKKNPDLLMVGLNDRDPAYHDLYKLEISTGKLTLLFKNTEKISGWDFDWDENLRLAYKTLENGNAQILKVNKDKSFTSIYETSILESAYVTGWSKDNTKVYLVSNKGDDVNFSSLFLMDLNTLKISLVEKDPLGKVDFGGASFSDVTRDMIVTYYTDAKTRRYWKNKSWEEAYTYLKSKFPGREVSMGSNTSDENKFLVAVYGDKYASESYFFNRETKELIHQYTPRPELKKHEAFLCEMQPITYKSSDGLEIPAYLTVPKYQTSKKLPLVMLIHGGPWARDRWGYHSHAQFLANRGFVVLQPNFRASTGFGKKFLDAGNMQWGMKMQDDITWGVKHLIKSGLVDEDRVAIMGGSYGGYATLAGVAYTPDVYACGVDIVGPSNLFTLLESIPAYWESFRKTMYKRMGDPNTEEGKAILKKESPLFFANQITSPLMIVQGANDPRVKQAESDQIVVALRDLGTDVEYILAEDEGHGFRKPVNNQGMFAATEKFLAKYCGTRYQESMTDDIAKRLKEMTQDISKVVYKKAEKITVAPGLPTLKNTLKVGNYNYDLKVEVQGQIIPMKMTREIKNEGDMWIITDASSSPMGNTSDTVYLKGMKQVKRIMSQGGQTIEMVISDNKISTSMMGKTTENDTSGAFLTDGAGLDLLIARLPLTKDYTLVYNTFDLMTQKMKTMKLEVLSEEEGIWKIRILNNANENDSTVLLIDQGKGMATSLEQVLPAMGNAKLTATLQ